MAQNENLKNFFQCSEEELKAAKKEMDTLPVEQMSDQALFIAFTAAERDLKMERLLSYGKDTEKYQEASKKYNVFLAEVMKRGIKH